MKPILFFACAFGLMASVQAVDFATTVLDATFKFYDPDSTSTCFLIQREQTDAAVYLVTTAHTVERTKGDKAVLVLRAPKPDGSYERRDHEIPIRHAGKPLWVRHPSQDVAVLKLGDPLPVSIAPLRMSALADEDRLKAEAVHICSPLFVLTFPQRFEANGAGFPVARQSIFASPPLLPEGSHPTFLADFTTFAGDSGGPVFFPSKDGQPLIAGIVLAQNHHEERQKGEYEERTIRYPLGLGTVLRARYVREVLDEAAKTKPKE